SPIADSAAVSSGLVTQANVSEVCSEGAPGRVALIQAFVATTTRPGVNLRAPVSSESSGLKPIRETADRSHTAAPARTAASAIPAVRAAGCTHPPVTVRA